jgi:hypothetical protein
MKGHTHILKPLKPETARLPMEQPFLIDDDQPFARDSPDIEVVIRPEAEGDHPHDKEPCGIEAHKCWV